VRRVAVLFLTLAVIAGVAFSAERPHITPSAKDKCPVCGMFVKKYPDWIGQIIFKDGSYALFDGAKDLFKYYLNLKKYNPSHTQAEIDVVYVTDYYRLEPVDAHAAHFVVGSDVYGPMGRELIPFSKTDDARDFMKDHKGKAILRFRDVTPEILKGLE
jgi:copper chaperone NosL